MIILFCICPLMKIRVVPIVGAVAGDMFGIIVFKVRLIQHTFLAPQVTIKNLIPLENMGGPTTLMGPEM